MKCVAYSALRILGGAALALAVVLTVPGPVSAQDASPKFTMLYGSPYAMQARGAGTLTPGFDYIPRLTTPLSELALGWRQGASVGRSRAAAQNLTLDNDQVHIRIEAGDAASADALIQRVEQAGGRVSARYKRWVAAWLPAGALEDLAGQAGVVYISQPLTITVPPVPPQPSLQPEGDRGAGSFLSQGVTVSNAHVWQSSAITGAGVKVGILDIGFHDYSGAVAAGELPPGLATLGTINTSDPHGTACAEIVYDMAPGVDMTIACASNDVEFAEKVEDLAEAGIQIISCSIGMWGGTPGDGTGPASEAINDAYTNYGVLFCKSAGNYARTHYDAFFQDNDSDTWHEFRNELTTETNSLGTVPANYLMDIRLRWDDWPTSDQDYDLYLYYKSGSSWVLIASSTATQSGTQPPFERIAGYVDATLEFGVKIKRKAGSAKTFLSLMNMGYGDFAYNQPRRSLNDESAALWSYSVAALDVVSPYTREGYSSWGPGYGPGGYITGGNDQPFLSGFANVDTWSYGPGVFNGTSSATPHVAGAAALVWSACPGFNALQVRQFLNGRAIDIGAPTYAGYDNIYGWGRLWLGDPYHASTCPAAPLGLLLAPTP